MSCLPHNCFNGKGLHQERHNLVTLAQSLSLFDLLHFHTKGSTFNEQFLFSEKQMRRTRKNPEGRETNQSWGGNEKAEWPGGRRATGLGGVGGRGAGRWLEEARRALGRRERASGLRARAVQARSGEERG